MQEVNKPNQTTYWVVRSEDGTVLHAGQTEPHQVTSTGQPVLVAGDLKTQIDEVAAFRGDPAAFNYQWDGSQWVFSGDVIYIPAASKLAEQLSRALFALVYGDKKPGLYARVIAHPSGEGYSLLAVRSDDVIPVALAVDPQPLIDVLQISIDDGALTQRELDGIAQAVSAMAGKPVKLIDFVPPSWKPYVMTAQQARAAGYELDV